MKKRPAIPRLDGGPQTILLVDDVGRTAEFYEEIMRLEVREGDGQRYVEFETGDGGVLLIVQREGSIAPMASAAAAGSPATLTFPVTADDYDTWKKWMAKRGVAVEQETKWIHGGRSLYVLDPDGRRIEFKAPAGGRGNAASEPPEEKPDAFAPVQRTAIESAASSSKISNPVSATAVPKPSAGPTTKSETLDQEKSHSAKVPVPRTPAAAPPIRGVVESILYTDDLPRAVSFYRDALGLAPMTGDGHRFQAFDSGSGRVLLLFKRGATLEPVPAPVGMIPPHDGRGPLHIAFAIDLDDYDAWRVRLRDQNIAIESETQWDRGGRSIYFRDPDKHLVELVTPGIWPNY